MALERESAFFDRNRRRWVAKGHGGKWATVYGEKLIGIHDSLETAFYDAAARLPGKQFFVKEITPKDIPMMPTRIFGGFLGAKKKSKKKTARR